MAGLHTHGWMRDPTLSLVDRFILFYLHLKPREPKYNHY